MRLFEAILAANQRALAGDNSAGVHVADYADELPVVALTCIDPRLTRLLPGALGLTEENFIWLRNAGNILTGPLSSTMRSIAMACAIKGGREIAVIGHTDCRVSQTSAAALIDRFKGLGVERNKLPDDIAGYFGLFTGERQNVVHCVDVIRSSPLIGPKTIVQGLVINIQTGGLDWVVNGYEMPPRTVVPAAGLQFPELGSMMGALGGNTPFQMGEMKYPDVKIGEAVQKATQAPDPLSAGKAPSILSAPIKPLAAPTPPPPILPPPHRPRPIPLPPPIRMNPRKQP
ncbi:MAG TPA: carbonic anhydrase [Verrucomicrobiae bacterium]|jgi:carbonic anhydrase|nr:carbonic anhydrase [Verrucomicrobiae bacterium]